MKRDSDIWLGDLLRAFHVLAPGDETTQSKLARMTGFAWMPRTPTVEAPEPPKPDRAVQESEPVADVRPSAQPRQPSPPDDLDGTEEELPFIGITESTGPSNEWKSVRPLAPYQHGQGRIPPPYQPVFRPEWSRALAVTLAATPLPIGEVDEARLVSAAASGMPTTVIPRKSCWSLALGVQLLLDIGPAMEPFIMDEIRLLELFRECIGPDHVQEARFVNCPSRGVLNGAILGAYRPPQMGVPVVAVQRRGDWRPHPAREPQPTRGVERPCGTSCHTGLSADCSCSLSGRSLARGTPGRTCPG